MGNLGLYILTATLVADQLLMTPFRSQNVPPPMSAYQISLPSVPVHLAFAPESDQLVVLFNDGAYRVYDLHTRIPRAGVRGGGAIARPEQTQEGRFVQNNAEWRQVSLTAAGEVYGLARESSGQDQLFSFSRGSWGLNGRAGRLTHDAQGGSVAMLSTGEILRTEGESHPFLSVGVR